MRADLTSGLLGSLIVLPQAVARLDSAICQASTARIFIECQTHLPDGRPRQVG